MRLVCNKCHHEWDENPSGSAVMAQCPECFSVVPLLVAKKAAPVLGTQETVVSSMPEAKTVTAIPTPKPTPPEEIKPSYGSRSRPPAAVTSVSETIMGPAPGPPDFKPDKSPGTEKTMASIFSQKTVITTAPTSPSNRHDSNADAFDQTTVVDRDDGRSGAARNSPTRTASTKTMDATHPKEVDLSGETIGGYEVKRMLGAGGMGAVCLARQISLDRDVALKILPGRFAVNPEFLVRFTREALSAAQMTHHNIIQVYDVGSDNSVHYISMEYVRGQNLGDMVRKDGKLRVDDATAYVLQAARGLKYAHERGIIHRDIKPDNLMVNDQGIVKIADMGLAKMSGQTESKQSAADPTLLKQAKGDFTMQDVAMGTPAYMPPEQARDASTVDARADQYSLGCTLYYLCAGEAPYSGSSAYEIISKHTNAPLPSLEERVRNVPGAISTIINRMLAKDREERYLDMGGVIRDLEAVLGVESEKGAYTPRERHLEILERETKKYYSASGINLRRLAKIGFFGVTAIVALVLLFSDLPAAAGGVLGLMLMTPIAGFIFDGIVHKTFLFRRVRSVFFGMPLKEWAITIALIVVTLGVLFMLNLLWYWIGFAVLAVGLAVGYQVQINRKLTAQRAEPIANLQDMLKQLRVRGVPEDAIQDFMCRFGGEHWEEMFEELFGYEAMILARGKWAAADKVKSRKKFGTWRDPIARWLDAVEEGRKTRRERKELAKVEVQRLKAQGVGEKEAQKQAAEAATQMLDDIKVAAQIAEPVSEKKMKTKSVSSGQKTVLGMALGFVRLVAGAAICILFACFFFQHLLPPALKPALNFLNALPIPRPVRIAICTFWGLGAGVALLVSGFSSRRAAPWLVVVGAAMIIGIAYVFPVITRFAPVEDLQLTYVACALMAAGLAICGFGKVTSGRF